MDWDMNATPPVEYAMTCRAGVWTLRRAGKVVMRSKNEPRVELKMSSLAKREAATTDATTITRKHRVVADGTTRTHSHVWTPEAARVNLAAIQEAVDRMLEIGREDRERKRSEGGGS
jgi:hypothetical protein